MRQSWWLKPEHHIWEGTGVYSGFPLFQKGGRERALSSSIIQDYWPTGPQHINCCPHRLIQSGKEDKSIPACLKVSATDLNLIEGGRCQPMQGNCMEPRMYSSVTRQGQKCSVNAINHNGRLSTHTLPRKMPWVLKLHKEVSCPEVIKPRYSFASCICMIKFQTSDISEHHKQVNRLTINNNLQQYGCKEARSSPAAPQHEKRWQYFFYFKAAVDGWGLNNMKISIISAAYW